MRYNLPVKAIFNYFGFTGGIYLEHGLRHGSAGKAPCSTFLTLLLCHEHLVEQLHEGIEFHLVGDTGTVSLAVVKVGRELVGGMREYGGAEIP